jgi:hypothetical protein
MRTLIIGITFTLLAVPCARGQDAPLPSLAIQSDLSYLENAWGMKKLAFTAELFRPEDRKPIGKVVPMGRITYTMAFDRDIRNYDLDALHRLFTPQEGKLRHLFFDANNIAINSIVPIGYLIQGELSGVKGDAVRVTIDFGHDMEILRNDPRGIDMARKLAVRPKQ